MELWKGDCLVKMKDISNNSVDCVICDLPYGTTNCHWDSKIDLQKLWEELLRIGKDTTPYFFCCDMKLAYLLIGSNTKMFKQDFVWNKDKISNPMLAKFGFGRSHENILVFYKKPPTYNYLKYHTKKRIDTPTLNINENNPDTCFYSRTLTRMETIYTPRLPKSVLDFDKPTKRKHPTEKPVPLLEHLIKYYTNEGDLVLDPTMGSGSTGEACRNLNRRFIGIELDKAIYETAVERLKC